MTEILPTGGHRRTKIIATLGPATRDRKTVCDLLKAGVDAVRLNFSHGSQAEHEEAVKTIHELCKSMQYHVAIIADLQGPKVRIQRFKHAHIKLQRGQKFVLDHHLGDDQGDEKSVGLTYKDLYKDVHRGDTLLLDDGRVELEVLNTSGTTGITTKVIHGTSLTNNKGLNRKGGGLSTRTITAKDRQDIRIATKLNVDYVAVSFPKSAADIILAKRLLQQSGSQADVVAKIERAEAVAAIDDILAVADGIMIARGDLSLEIGDAELTAVQKALIRKARQAHKIAIIATEMMQSMITSPIPTRAEISDVANAVLDRSDAVMLSGETAIGQYPVLAVSTMSRICIGAEKGEVPYINTADHCDDSGSKRIDFAVALAATYLSCQIKVAAIAALTESGSTALWMSRMFPLIPIYALTPHMKTKCKVTLYRGVYPGTLNTLKKTHSQVNRDTAEVLKKCGIVKDDDLIIITKGDLMGKHGGTNAIKVLRVGKVLDIEN